MLPAATGSGRGKKRSRRPPGRPPQHGAATLTRVLRGIRLDRIHGASQAGVYLRRVYGDLVAHLGGAEQVTATEALLLEG